MPLRIEIAETLESVDALAGEWAALEAQTPEATGFQSYAWCRAWLQAVGVTRGCRPRVVTVWDDRRLVMLWPLQIEAAFGATIVRWIGEPMTQYGDALAGPGDDRAYWRDAVDAEFSRWNDVDLFAFTRLRADGVVAATTTASLNGDGFMAAPFVDLEFPVKPARRHRKRFERRARLLATFGPVRFAEVIDPAERARLARSAIAIKLGWLRRQ